MRGYLRARAHPMRAGKRPAVPLPAPRSQTQVKDVPATALALNWDCKQRACWRKQSSCETSRPFGPLHSSLLVILPTVLLTVPNSKYPPCCGFTARGPTSWSRSDISFDLPDVGVVGWLDDIGRPTYSVTVREPVFYAPLEVRCTWDTAGR